MVIDRGYVIVKFCVNIFFDFGYSFLMGYRYFCFFW